jgi:SNF2 family DNA or RNA helicase
MYDDLEYSQYDEETHEPIQMDIGELQALRMESELLKVPSVISWTNDLIEQGYNVAIFTNYTQTLADLAKGLKTNCVFYGGNVESRDHNIDEFQNNKSNVIILNIAAGGQSISLHDLYGRPRIAIIFPTWSAQQLIQATGRIHRAGSKSGAIQYIVYAAGTIEDMVKKKVLQKIKNINTLNDGDLQADFLTPIKKERKNYLPGVEITY